MPVRVGCVIGGLDRLLASLQEAVRSGHIPVVSLRSTTANSRDALASYLAGSGY